MKKILLVWMVVLSGLMAEYNPEMFKSTLFVGKYFDASNTSDVKRSYFHSIMGMEMQPDVLILGFRFSVLTDEVPESRLQTLEQQIALGLPVIENFMDLFVGYEMGFNENNEFVNNTIIAYTDITVWGPLAFEIIYGYGLKENSQKVSLLLGGKF
ncbi:MAG: hypothetical protein KU37_07435 [Sulfuricurvum sp. PC08-66]|nr:MAG: hypothetical protein KU37_07435 [Sulfuricurvum sp. PC08-66]